MRYVSPAKLFVPLTLVGWLIQGGPVRADDQTEGQRLAEAAGSLVGLARWAQPRMNPSDLRIVSARAFDYWREGQDHVGRDIDRWLRRETPRLDERLTMNCWELPMMAGVRAGLWSRNDVCGLFGRAAAEALTQGGDNERKGQAYFGCLLGGLGCNAARPLSPDAVLAPGDIVHIYRERPQSWPCHVAIATGVGDEVISLWNGPPKHHDQAQRVSLKRLLEFAKTDSRHWQLAAVKVTSARDVTRSMTRPGAVGGR